MSEQSILTVPDEVKLRIFDYLDGVSKLELSKTCSDLERIFQDRHVIKRLSFYKNYKTRLAHFKLRCPMPLYNLVTHLNLSSVYWIPSAQLRYVLLKFVELTYLNVTDTQLTFRDLTTVLKTATKVHKLGISLRTDYCSDVIFLKLDNRITHFYVTYSSSSLRSLVNVLTNFEELEELWMIEPKGPGNINASQELPWVQYTDQPLPKVKNKFVFTKQSTLLTDSLSMLEQIKIPGNWIELVKNRAPIFVVTEKFPDSYQFNGFNPQIQIEEKLSYINKNIGVCSIFCAEDVKNMIVKNWSYSDYCFTYINLSRTSINTIETPNLDQIFEALEVILFSKNMRKLKKIKLSSLFMYMRKVPLESVYLPLFKKPRIGSGSIKTTQKCFFSQITTNLVEIEDLEIVNDYNNIRISKWECQVDSLKYISNWKMLKSLTLTNIPFNNGKFFIEITKNCPFLNRLKIKDIVPQDKISKDLCVALRYAARLLDFRYERDGYAPIDELFDSLTNCLNLERLYIQCRNSKSISKKPLETLLSVCEKLVFFFIYISDYPDSVCKTIKQSISHYNIKPIQIFCIRGRTYNLNNIIYDDIPSVHIRDMVCQSSDFSEYLDTF